MAADTNGGAAGDEAEGHAFVERARERCRALIKDLRLDAESLGRPSRLVSPEALAEGSSACDRAAAAAQRLLRQLEQPPSEPT